MITQSKNILVISYYWPPAGGPGVQRWLGFVKHLPSFGFFPHVFVPENPSYPILDQSLMDELPNDYVLIKKKIWEPYHLAEWVFPKSKEYKKGNLAKEKNGFLAKLLISIRGNFFIPDARKFWVTPSVRFLKKYIEENNISTIITTGPPHSLHLIGLQLKNHFPQLHWLADFRDPWTEISYHSQLNLSNWAKKQHLKLEKQVLTNADVVIATSFTDAENYRKKGAKTVTTITNGFEPTINSKKGIQLEYKKFVLAYVGGLEDLRNPDSFWQLLEEILEENVEISNAFVLKLVGNISQNILDKIKTHHKKLAKCIEKIDYLPHQQAIEEMQKANALLLINFMDEKSKGIIPGKLFEYLATENPIFAIGPKNGDVEKILTETQAGFSYSDQNKKEAKEYIEKIFLDWKNEKQTESINVEKYTRTVLTRELSKYL